MTAFRDELTQLTADQPAQPADRLGAVTSRAGRIRRTRVAVSALAALAIATPVALTLTNDGSSTARVVPASSPSSWPDRSPAGDRAVAAGALAQWSTDSGSSTASTHWLYRGPVSVPGGAPLYVVAWVADGKVVMGSVERSRVDGQGRSATTGSPWELSDTPVAQAPTQLSLYLRRLAAVNSTVAVEVIADNWLFVLADPEARSLHWTAAPLENAPTGGDIVDEGSLRSRNGVFQGWTGTITGRLTSTVDHVLDGTVPLRFPDDEPVLAGIPRTEIVSNPNLIASGSGQLFDADPSSEVNAFDPAPGSNVHLTCYGGGAITVVIDDVSRGQLACDLQEHTVPVPDKAGQHTLHLRGDRFQVFDFVIDHT
jgi:hypothetical protein